MGNVKNAQDKIEDAAMYYKASLRSDQSSSIILASTFRGMAKVLALQKSTDDAMALFQSIIETGENLPVQVVVDSHVDMANLLRDRGDFNRAIEFYESALQISRLKYGEEHQNVATILQNMARILRRNGDTNVATELYKKSLDVTKRTLGEDHLSTAEIYQSMGLMTQNQGSLETAFDLYGKALKMYQKRFGEFHSQVADSYDMLASVRWQENLYHEARDLHDNSRRIRNILNARKSSGEDLTTSLTAKDPHFDEHLVGEDHPYFVFSLRCRCHHLLHSDNPERSLLPYRELVDILQRNFDNQQTEIASAYQEMATLLRRLGRIDEAMETYEIFRSMMSQEKYKTLGAEYKFEWAMTYEEMARLLQEQSRESDALEVIVDALEMRKEMALKSGIHTLKTLFTFKSFIKISEQALENNRDELFCAKVTGAQRAVLASGLEIYHELLVNPTYQMHQETMMKQHNQMDRLGSVLFDALTSISASIGGILHAQVCELGDMVSHGDPEALGAKLPNMIEYLRGS